MTKIHTLKISLLIAQDVLWVKIKIRCFEEISFCFKKRVLLWQRWCPSQSACILKGIFGLTILKILKKHFKSYALNSVWAVGVQICQITFFSSVHCLGFCQADDSNLPDLCPLSSDLNLWAALVWRGDNVLAKNIYWPDVTLFWASTLSSTHLETRPEPT